MAMNFIERAITPYNRASDEILAKEQYNLFAPAAGINKPGLAGFDPEHFAVREQIVRLSDLFLTNLDTRFAELDNAKLEKITDNTTGKRFVYAVEINGDQSTIPVVPSGYDGDSIAMRTGNGALFVAMPTQDYHATPKKYVDDWLVRKVEKIENADAYYDFAYLAKKNNGGTTTLKVDTGNQGYTIAKRTSTGALAVSTPTADSHATPKKYVDDGLAGKLGKSPDTSANVMVYATQNGDTTMLKAATSTADAFSLARRGASGVLTVGTPTADSHAVNLAYLNKREAAIMAVAEGKVKSYTVSTLAALGALLGIDTSTAAKEYTIPSTTITYNGEQYQLRQGDVFLIVATDVPDYWVSIDDMKLYVLETMKVDLTEYAKTAEMKAYVAENAISLTTTGTIEPAAGSRVMTLGSNGNVILIEGNPSSYMLVGVKSNGDPVMYKPNNYSAESQTVAVRGARGVLTVGAPTTASHATTKQYVDEKCVTVNCDLSTLSWTKAGQVGPDEVNDIAWTTPYSALGIKSGAKSVIWTLTNMGYPYKTGSCVFGTNATSAEQGGLVQFTADGKLTIIGANSPSMTSAPYATFIVFY